MRKEYDFTKAVRNPYVKKEKKAVTIRLAKELNQPLMHTDKH